MMKLSEYKSSNKVFLVAEVGQAHEGSFGILMSFIPHVAKAGFDAIKFQMHIAEAESSEYENFRVPYPSESLSRMDYWKRMEFSQSQWEAIKTACENNRIELLVTPFSVAAVHRLERLGVNRYKVGSGDTLNMLLLEAIKETKKELIISGGLLSKNEFEEQIKKLLQANFKLAVLQCTTSYPTNPKSTYLADLASMLREFTIPVGYSDHSGTIYPGMAAVALGADIVEVHVTFDRHMYGPDATSSIEIRELDQFVKGIRFLEEARISSRATLSINNSEEMRRNFGRSLALNRNMSQGEHIKVSDLESKKPSGFGIPVEEFRNVVGKKLLKNKMKWDFLLESDLGT